MIEYDRLTKEFERTAKKQDPQGYKDKKELQKECKVYDEYVRTIKLIDEMLKDERRKEMEIWQRDREQKQGIND